MKGRKGEERPGAGSRSLGELLASAGVPDAAGSPGAPTRPTGRTPITGITASSRDVREGHLFVAIRGTRTDGHAFLDEAVRRGAAAVLVESPPAALPRDGESVPFTDEDRLDRAVEAVL